MFISWSSAASASSRLGDIFKVTTLKILLAIMREVAMECGTNVPNTELLQTVVKCNYLMGGWFLTIFDLDLGK